MQNKQRFLEIDLLRGIAICLMIVFHALFDLNYFKGFSFNLDSGLWLLVGRSAALLFFFLVGISLTLSHSKGREFGHFLKRGFGIIALGLLITAVTLLLFPKEAIWFGVLHFIGVSIILAFPFLKLKRANVLVGILIIVAGVILWNLSFNFAWLLPVGFQPQGFESFDYFPILPWFGIVLFGIAFGNKFYNNAKRSFKPLNLENYKISRLLAFLGRNSLLVYLLHQPVIIAVLLFVL
ncbi:DUF1624 domain-containing protein [archaeon]|nr:DUF1624 domain-containing protein [archaeon]